MQGSSALRGPDDRTADNTRLGAPPGEARRATCEGFENAVVRHRAALLDYARRRIPRRLRGVLDPQDILQDTLLEAFRHWDQFDARDAGAARRWLRAIAHNQLFNAVKAQFAAKRGGAQRAGRASAAGDWSSACDGLEQAADVRGPSDLAIAGELAAAIDVSMGL